MQTARILLAVWAIVVLLFSCNRNSDQLPPKKAPPTELVISSKTNGLAQVDFIFHQTRIASGDTVWLSIRNNTNAPIVNLKYIVELCKAVPQNYDNCDLQVHGLITDSIQSGQTRPKVFTWINRNIRLDSSLINTGVIAHNSLPPHPLGNVYSNIYASFETDSEVGYYGTVRGYVLADGLARFRIKGKDNDQFNATGLFTQAFDFTGNLYKDNSLLTPFKLDSITVNGNRQLIDTANNKFNFRLALQKPVRDTIQSLLLFTQRNF
ncbi:MULTISPECIES: hypothetical protein [Niastella]|uniref:Uncharacterized protein n=1 Tax=Niastella soli TaxID=2821487 RepID=A0ABS3Z0U1_9BACT|nr:hypothetical protein [Niastella soli]MBO9203382.1 hypothetical protein [Niastella soli]